MNCRCGGVLTPQAWWFERVVQDGAVFRKRINGLVCGTCGEEVLTGKEAERVSRQWHRVWTAST